MGLVSDTNKCMYVLNVNELSSSSLLTQHSGISLCVTVAPQH